MRKSQILFDFLLNKLVWMKKEEGYVFVCNMNF
jgi:hypothetical protein